MSDTLLYSISNINQIIKDRNLSIDEVVDILDREDISYYYTSYNRQDIIDCAKDEGIPLEDIEIHEIAGAYFGFQRGVVWM